MDIQEGGVVPLNGDNGISRANRGQKEQGSLTDSPTKLLPVKGEERDCRQAKGAFQRPTGPSAVLPAGTLTQGRHLHEPGAPAAGGGASRGRTTGLGHPHAHSELNSGEAGSSRGL